MSNGLFIVIEGPDASGKETQHDLLVDRLQQPREDDEHPSYDVYAQDFPAYGETAAGRKLYNYLHDDAQELSNKALAQLYVDDRRELRDDLQNALQDGKIVVADRYAQSNYAYQTADMNEEERWAFIDWLKEEEADLPDPDLVIYIDMPVEQCNVLIQERGAEDRNESDTAYLSQVIDAYREIAEKEGWTVIDPMHDNWQEPITGTDALRSPEAIHTDIWDAVEPHLP